MNMRKTSKIFIYQLVLSQDKRKSEGSGQVTNGKNGEKDKKEGENSSLKSFPPKASATTDDVRLSCRKMLANALRGIVIIVIGIN